MKLNRLLYLYIGILLCFCACTTPEINSGSSLADSLHCCDRVDRDLSAFDLHVTELTERFAKRPFNPSKKELVKEKLAHMFEVDQYMRHYSNVVHEHSYSKQEKEYFSEKFNPRWQSIDKSNTASLKDLLNTHEWFNISEFGQAADNQAWLLVQHADLDIEFQKRVLRILANLYPRGETSRSNYAYLYDRVAIADKQLQRYGTQGKCVGLGKWEPHAIEEPSTLDSSRTSMELVSMTEYTSLFKDICKQGK
jgi:hypothetical protein